MNPEKLKKQVFEPFGVSIFGVEKGDLVAQSGALAWLNSTL
ncbi:hypothetical protein ACWIW6_10780 [Ursidibacter sp. B-7004-1]